MIRSDLRVDSPSRLQDIRALLEGSLSFTNFEAAIYDSSRGQTIRDGRFASPPGALESLCNVGFNLVGFANNHSYDLGEDGIVATADAAARLGLGHPGIGRNVNDASRAHTIETPGGRIALIALASGLVMDGRAADGHPGVNELRVEDDVPDPKDANRVLGTVRDAASRADIVIVSHHNHHYPGIERPVDFKQMLLSQLPERLAPPAWFEQWARDLVDAGADVVAGHGPPFLHGMEVYRGKPIFYSLGNFIFQVPPESIHLEEPIMWESVVAHVDFVDGDPVNVRLQPLGINKIGSGLPNPHDQFDVNEYHRTRGLPRRAEQSQARHLLARLQGLSSAYGTEIHIAGEVAQLGLAASTHAETTSRSS